MRQSAEIKYWLAGMIVVGLMTNLSGWVIDRPVNAQVGNGAQPIAPTSGTPTSGTPTSGPQRRPLRPQDVWQIVYQQLPTLPLENQYVNRETGNVDPNNTLVSRLMRYHLYVKGRPPNYRLDWKLTLADYLGANEPIDSLAYPGADILKQNPVEQDVAIIKQLDRAQRDTLVQALVNIFAPPAPQPNLSAPAISEPTPTPTLPARSQPPASGGARLLLP